ncbi:MAG: hypothetical protein ACYTEG_13140 [Planctomycetota bacterium]
MAALIALSAVGAAEPRPTWICHFDPRMAAAASPTYRDLLDSIPQRAKLFVAVASHHDSLDFRRAMGLLRFADPRVEFVTVGHAVTGWARDRYILFDRGGRRCIAVPPIETVDNERAGDLAVAHELCRRLPQLQLVETELALEGGNVLLANDHVFVGIGDVLGNAARLRTHRRDVERRIELLFDRPLVVVGAPHSRLAREHIDMFLSPAPDGSLLLGSPRLAYGCLEDSALEPLGRFPRPLQRTYRREYDAIAAELRHSGFRVRRTPILHAADGAIVTWNNAAVSTAEGRAVVLVPSYGLGELERRAHAVWRRGGAEVRPICVQSVIGLGGAVRCITNRIGIHDDE